MRRSPNVARPSAPVGCTRVPESVPVPLPSDTVTGIPRTLTGTPALSTTCTVSDGAITCPTAVLPGCWTIASLLAAGGRLVRANTADPVTVVEDAVTP